MIDLAQQAAHLKRLVGTLSNAAKTRREGKPDAARKLEEAARLAGQFNWPKFVDELKRACDEALAQREASLQSRREKLLQAARAAGEPFNESTRAVRVGVFRVEFEGESAVTTLGGVEVERTKEADGKKLYKRLQDLRGQLERSPFKRESFFKQIKAAYAACCEGRSRDKFVSIRDLHRELVLEGARSHHAFRKRPEPKNVPAYPMYQFVFDLARFIRGGVSVGDERLVTTTPSMRESASTIFIPSLDHPLGNETSAARLAIKKNS